MLTFATSLNAAFLESVAPEVGEWEFAENRCASWLWGYPSEGAAVAGGIQRHYTPNCSAGVVDPDTWPTGATGDDSRAGCMVTYGGLPVRIFGIESSNRKNVLIGMTRGPSCTYGEDGLFLQRRRPVACPIGSTWNGASCIRVGVDPYKNNDTCPANGTNPIHSSLGTKLQRETDLELGTLSFERYYSSAGIWQETHLGPNWRHTFDRRISLVSTAGATTASVYRPNGNVYRYATSDGVHWTSDPDVSETLTATLDGSSNVIAWELVDPNDTIERYDADGVLTQIELPRSGQVLTFTYVNTLLTEVTDERSRKLRFEYDATLSNSGGSRSRLVRVITPDNRITAYGYNTTSGILTSVTFPDETDQIQTDNPKRTYLYEDPSWPKALTGIELFDGATSKRVASWGYRTDNGKAWFSTHGSPTSRVDRHELTYNSDGTTTIKQFLDDSETSPRVVTRTYAFTIIHGVVKQTTASKPCGSCGTTQAVRAYDAEGDLASTTDFRDMVTLYDFDARNLEHSRTDASSVGANSNPLEKRTTVTTWHPTHRVPTERTVTNASAQVESLRRWSYNQRGQAVAECAIDPANASVATYQCGAQSNAPQGVRQTTRSYCDSIGPGCPLVGLLRTVNGPRVDVTDETTYSYYSGTDESGCDTGGECHRVGDLWKITDALNHVTEFKRYDRAGRVTQTVDANLVKTDLEYHPRGWLKARKVRGTDPQSEADDAITRMTYDAAGNVTRVTSPDNSFVDYIYDSANRLTQVVDNLGNRIIYKLDAAGHRIQEDTHDPSYSPSSPNASLRRTMGRDYNSDGQLGTSRDGQNNATNYSLYDSNENLKIVADPTGIETHSSYDALNRLEQTIGDKSSVSGHVNATTNFEYDARDNIRKVIDPKLLQTRYTYDGLNDLTLLESPDTGNTIYTYDRAGNRYTALDARNVQTSYSYDSLNRPLTIAYSAGTLPTSFQYDLNPAECGTDQFGVGRLTGFTDESGSTTYCYDRRGNVVTRIQVVGSEALTTRWTYDLADRVVTIQYPSGNTVRYVRATNGRIQTVYLTRVGQAEQLVATSMQYEPMGPLKQLVFADGGTLTYAYDNDYDIDAITSSRAQGLTVDFSIDSRGNVSSIGGDSYWYDGLNRLTEYRDPAGIYIEKFTYDATGNRLSAQKNGQRLISYSYPTTNHRLTSVGSQQRTYDSAGNTLQGAGTGVMSYGGHGRPTQWTKVYHVDYKYNARGERVSRVMDAESTVSRAYNFNLDGKLLGETEYTQLPCPPHCDSIVAKGLNDKAAPLLRDGATTLGGGVSATHAEYIYADDRPIAFVTPTQVAYIETDHLSTPRKAFGNGALAFDWPLVRNPYGETSANTSLQLNLRFPGQQLDPTSGLHYNYLRDYDGSIGRYVQSDPIGLSGGVSTYGYVLGNPMRLTDPFGLEACSSNCCEKLPWVGPTGVRVDGTVRCCNGKAKICLNPNRCNGLRKV